MPARIRILSGPDEGSETVLHTGEVRIGRGVGCKFQVRDGQFNGHLRVFFRGATYWVANETGSAGWVIAPNDEATSFAAGEERVWDNGYRIQPTANTLIVLQVEEAAGGGDGEPGPDQDVVVTRVRTPAEEKKARDRLYLIVTAMTAPLAVVLFMQPSVDSGPAAPTRNEVARRFDAVMADLDTVTTHRQYGRSAAMVRGLIQDARREEVASRPAEASAGYQQARDELDRALGDRPSDDRRSDPAAVPPADPAADVLRAARAFAADRLVQLGVDKSSNRK